MPSNLWKAESTSLELSVAGFPAVTRDLGEGPGGGGAPLSHFRFKKLTEGTKASRASKSPPPLPHLSSKSGSATVLYWSCIFSAV